MTRTDSSRSGRAGQRRWRRLAIIAVAAMALLLLAPRLFDGEALRARLADAASAALGHPVSIDGDVGLRLLPRPALMIEGVTAGNPGWPGQAILMTAEHIVATPALLDLALGRIALSRFDAHGVEVWLEHEPSGRLNWTPTERTAADPAGGSGLPGLDAFAARRVTLHVRGVDGDAVTLDQVTIEGSIVDGTVSARLQTHVHGLAALVPALANLSADAGDIKAHAVLEFDPAGELRVTEVAIGEGAAAASGAIAIGWREATPTIDGRVRIDRLSVPGDCPNTERPPAASAAVASAAQPSRLLPRWRGRFGVEVGELAFDGLRLDDLRLRASGDGDTTTVVVTAGDERVELAVTDSTAHVPGLRIEARIGAASSVRGLICAGLPPSLVAGLTGIELTARGRGRTGADLLGGLEGRLQIGGEVAVNAAGWRLGDADARVSAGRLDALTLQLRSADASTTAVTVSGGPLRGLLGGGWPFTATWNGAGSTLEVDGRLDRAGDGFAAAGGFSGTLKPGGEAAASGVTGNGRWRITRDAATLSGLSVTMARSRMTGSLQLDSSASRPTLSGDLVFPVLDVDALAALPTGASDRAPASPGLLLDGLRIRVTQLEGLPVAVSNVDARVHHDGERVRVDALALDVESAAVRGALELNMKASPLLATFDLSSAKVPLASLLQAWLPAKTPGAIDDLAIRGRASGRRFGELAASLEVDASAGSVSVDAPPGGIGPLRLDSVDVRMRPGAGLTGTADATVGGESLKLALASDPGTGRWNVTADGKAGKARIDGDTAALTQGGKGALSISARGEDTTRLLGLLGPAAARPMSAWRGAWKLDMQLARDGDDVVARPLTASVAGIGEVHGDARVVSAHGARPRLVGRLEAQRLDLSTLRADTDAGTASTRPGPRGVTVPMPPVLAFDAELVLAAGTLIVGDTRIDRLGTRLRSEPGLLSLEDMRLTLADGGTISGRIALARDAAAPRLTLSLRGSDVNLGALRPDDAAYARFTWPADVSVELDGSGQNLGEVLEAGGGSLRIKGGSTVERTENLSALEINVLALMLPRFDNGGTSRLNCALLDASLDSGLLASRALVLDAETVTIAGAGSIDLGAGTIDLMLASRPKNPGLLGRATPVHVSGPLLDPDVSAATGALIASATTGILGTINPFLLLGSFVSAGDVPGTGKEPCERALEQAAAPARAAQEEAAELEDAQSKSIGDLLRAPFRALGRGLDSGSSATADR